MTLNDIVAVLMVVAALLFMLCKAGKGGPPVLWVVAAILEPSCSAHQGARMMPQPVADLRATANVAFAPRAEFLFRLRLDQRLSCPGIGWDFGDGEHAYRESDCEPDELGPLIYERWKTYRVPGTYLVRADVAQAGVRLASATTSVTVRGFGE